MMETTNLSSALALGQKAELSSQSPFNGVFFLFGREICPKSPQQIRFRTFRNYTNLPRLFFVFLFFRQQKGEWSMVPLMVGLVNCVACFSFPNRFCCKPAFHPFLKRTERTQIKRP